jgi:hypothetical protein
MISRENQTPKAAAGDLVSEVGKILDDYLVVDDQLFSWKNAFGWNDVAALKDKVEPLSARLVQLLEKTKAQQSQISELPEEDPEKSLLMEFYPLFANYVDTLKMAVQNMGRVLAHIDTKRNNKAEFKQARYESDLIIYKAQVDKYQLFGEKLNSLLKRL